MCDLSPRAASELLGISTSAIKMVCEDGYIREAWRKPPTFSHWVIPLAALIDYAARHKIPIRQDRLAKLRQIG